MLWNNTQQHKQSRGFRSLFPPLTWKVHISTRTQLLHCSDLKMQTGGVIGERGGGGVTFCFEWQEIPGNVFCTPGDNM